MATIWLLDVDANGYDEGEGTHVSVFACIVKGDYDAELNWPFVGNITFTLLNQLADKNHHSNRITVTKENNVRVENNWGFRTFTPHSGLSL